MVQMSPGVIVPLVWLTTEDVPESHDVECYELLV